LAAVALITLASSARAQVYTRRGKDGVIEATNIPDSQDFRLTYPGKGTLIHSRGFRGFYNGEYDRHILDAASVYGVAADLVRAVIQVESEFDRMAVSSKGAQGLMQLMPFTARRFGVADPFDPRQNIFAGVQYLRLLMDLFQGDVGLALAGYNAGENAVARYKGIPPYKETQNYVRKIQGLLGVSGGSARMISFAPSRTLERALDQTRPARKPGPIVPARPRIYYKWRDGGGLLHVAQTPPNDAPYTMIRALD
jgi:hypothetical protein